jgi:hypothetical protein
MSSLKRLFAPKEIQIALNVLDELGYEFKSDAFTLVRNRLENTFLKDQRSFISELRKTGKTPRQQVFLAIANISGNFLESDRYHLYRGVLDPLGPAKDLLRLFDMAVDRLVQSGAENKEMAIAAKSGLRENLKQTG